MMVESRYRVEPKDHTTGIWRYMTFDRYQQLIEQSGLWFSRLDLLQDQFEGMIPDRHFIGTVEWSTFIDPSDPSATPQPLRAYTNGMQAMLSSGLDFFRELTHVNCWHVRDHEATDMWNIYLNSQPGVAIHTTFGRLKTSLNSNHEHLVEFSKIHYIDHRTFVDPEAKWPDYMVFKRREFSHESELRAISLIDPRSPDRFTCSTPKNKGSYLSVDLPTLLHRVVLQPRANSDLSDRIKALHARHGLESVPLAASALDSQPTR